MVALLCVMFQASATSHTSKRLRSSPDVAEEVKKETQQNIT